MSSSQPPDYLTSLVSYVPDLNFGLNRQTGAVNQFGTSVTNQVQQPASSSLESVDVVSARANRHLPQSPNSPQPLRSALKKTSWKVPDKLVEESKSTEKFRKQEQALTPTRLVQAKHNLEKSKPVPARLLQRKKTVAFGRTVNVSQTVEGTSRRHRRDSAGTNFLKNNFRKMATDDQNEMKDEVEKLKKKVDEMQTKIDELTSKDAEQSDQILKLTEMMKKVLEEGTESEVLHENKSKTSKKRGQKVIDKKHYRGKENIPPNELYAEDLSSEIDENSPNVAGDQELFAKTDRVRWKKTSKEDLKWALMKRKYEENEEFKRLVDEAIMKYGGDESLDIVASKQCKGDTGRARSRQREKKSRPVTPSPVIRSTTRVTKQMTVEQIHQCESSPARSGAFSLDSKKYLARHGIIPALSDDDEMGHKMAYGRRSEPSMQSDYRPGNSVTYYSKHGKCIGSPLKHDRWTNLPRNRASEGRHYQYRENKRPARTVLNETNYQVDHFDTDQEDENADDIIEMSDDSEVEERYARGAKMRSPRDAKDWKDSSRNDFCYQRNDDARHCVKQRLNKSAWN